MKPIRFLVLTVLAAVASSGYALAKTAAHPTLRVTTLDGKTFDLAAERGKWVVVNFWATWCAPCREEMPQFVAAQARDGARGVQFVGIAVDDPVKVRAFAAEIGLNYPALIGGYGAIELSKTLGNDLSALPFTIVLDRQGRVAHAQLGPLKAAQLNDLLSSLLQTS